ncbi:hypothetical protein G3A39_42540 [Paraburkholderia aspalathi]|nr:hypothetical protein [Paraburkholderia aspalathi]
MTLFDILSSQQFLLAASLSCLVLFLALISLCFAMHRILRLRREVRLNVMKGLSILHRLEEVSLPPAPVGEVPDCTMPGRYIYINVAPDELMLVRVFEESAATNSPETATGRLDDLGSVQDGLKMSSDGQLPEGAQ